MTKKLLTATVLAFALAAPGSAAAQTAATLPDIYWEVVPGAIYNTSNHGITLTFGCRTVTHNATWSPGGTRRNSIVKLQIRLRAPAADGTYALGGPSVWSSGRLIGTRMDAGAQSCDLARGVDTVSFTNIALPAALAVDPKYIAKLQIAVRFYRGERYEPHKGLQMTNQPWFYFVNGGFTDNLNDGLVPATSPSGDDF